ncbi:uncharacterized protein LOC131946687 isoform X2 [Physella acuta]|nr:uncharacterized protein LOC131946687 isoform X2 [Physella acuta]XP_059163580.1 uncharacterized protein LOC131946687 isoform X2 [Physella acuta]
MYIWSSLTLTILCVWLVQSSVLLYSSEQQPQQQPQQQQQQLYQVTKTKGPEVDDKVYLFAADGKRKPYSYINDVGTLIGFDVDFVNEVCALVGKKCHIILAEFTECIYTDRSIDYAGRGLMARWFDGCPGYAITTDRLNEFDFTLPYLDGASTFAVLPGNPPKFDPLSDDYSHFNIVHLTGAPTNEPCLRRLHKKFGKIIIASDLPEAKMLLLNRTADVLFSPRERIDGLEVLPNQVRCDRSGAGIMLKKGSTVPTWWDPAFKTLYFSGSYNRLCEEASKKYEAPIHCLPGPDKASPELLAIMKRRPRIVPEKLWTFVVSGRIAPYSYLNQEGELVGFTKDLLSIVCAKAGKSCSLLLAGVPECSVRKGEILYPGRGLMENWFDACTGYFDTLDRDNSWDFTLPYLVSYASFYVAKGNPSGFNPDASDYSLYTIVYTETSISNDHCLNRLHKKYKKLVVVPDRPDAIAMLLNGSADAWFTKDDGSPDIELLPQHFHCENVGTSIMTKKGGELPMWWNPAFEEFYNSGEYNDFCLERGKHYKNDFPCLPPPSEKKLHKSQEGF